MWEEKYGGKVGSKFEGEMLGRKIGGKSIGPKLGENSGVTSQKKIKKLIYLYLFLDLKIVLVTHLNCTDHRITKSDNFVTSYGNVNKRNSNKISFL